MNLSRRQFLSATALAGLTPVPRVLLEAALRPRANDEDATTLVVLQLSGGNDALNTVIPGEDPIYRRERPTLAVGEERVLSLARGAFDPAGVTLSGAAQAEHIGFHPEMKALWELYGEGRVAVVQGVGYPNPSRSHFRSMDIWHTARPDVEDTESGWLGRTIDRHSGAMSAVDIGHAALPLALRGETEVPSLQNLDWLDELASPEGRRVRSRLRALHAAGRTGPAERVRRLAVSTFASLDRLVELRNRPVPVEYPDSRLADRLKWAAQLISGHFPARVLYLSLGGFDTHAQQREHHERLLRDLSGSVAAFFRHLEAQSEEKRVTVLVFSEFGRRVRENGSRGTDHGVAAPLFLISGKVRGGVYGPHPRLDDLDDGDLRFHTDFRRIYATLLDRWLGVGDSKTLLGGEFAPLDVYA